MLRDTLPPDTMQPGETIAHAAGFDVVSVSVANYFNHAGVRGRTYTRLCNLFPSSFRDGITILLEAI